MDSQALVMERKIIGVLIRAAREKAQRTPHQVAHRLGTNRARVRQYEMGEREITLPELEILSLYLNVPLSFFLGTESIPGEAPVKPPTPEEMRTRRAIVAAKLKQARLAAGKSREECARAIERTPVMFDRYERGQTDVPLTELDRLAHFLGVTVPYFVQDGAARRGGGDVMDLEAWARLPAEVRAFIMEPNSLPYLRMAMKFRDLPTARLKELGEILLVVR